MSSGLNREDVAKVANLARLTISDQEAEKFAGQLEAVFDHFKEMEALDLAGVEAIGHPLGLENVMREDVVRATLDREEVLACAPHAVDGRFSVPRILGEEP